MTCTTELSSGQVASTMGRGATVLGFALSVAAFLASPAVQAAPDAPTAVLTGPDSFVEYTGAGPIGNNNININDKLYWLYESSGTYLGESVNSWLVFFDPVRDTVQGAVTFDSTILFVQDDQSELIATSGFGKVGLTYDYSSPLIGLEAPNKAGTTYVGDTMTLSWRGSFVGDHVRIMTQAQAVPEPETYALMLAGLGVAGLLASRRRQR